MLPGTPSPTTVRTGPYTAVRKVDGLSVLCSVLSKEATPRRRCFLAALYSRGFTPTLLREPCRNRLLRRCTFEVRSVYPPFAFGPSSARLGTSAFGTSADYYGLC